MKTRSFRVEHAGCSSCADRVRAALAHFGNVDAITVDEDADVADVVLRTQKNVDRAEIDAALAEASVGSGHTYRIATHSWR